MTAFRAPTDLTESMLAALGLSWASVQGGNVDLPGTAAVYQRLESTTRSQVAAMTMLQVEGDALLRALRSVDDATNAW